MSKISLELLKKNRNQVYKKLDKNNQTKLMSLQLYDENKDKPEIVYYVQKTLKNIEQDQIERENNFKDLDSKFIAKCYGIDQINKPYNYYDVIIYMEYLKGGTLQSFCDYLKTNLSSNDFEKICIYSLYCCLNGLKYLIDKKIGHRDIKPTNICISNDGYVKLIDFGISTKYQFTHDYQSTLIGTQEYLAPEILLEGKGKCRKTDIFALGVTIYKLLFNEHPYIQDILNNQTQHDLLDDITSYYKELKAQKFKLKIEDSKYAYSKNTKKIIEQMILLDNKRRPDVSIVLNDAIFKFLKNDIQFEQQAKYVAKKVKEFLKSKKSN